MSVPIESADHDQSDTKLTKELSSSSSKMPSEQSARIGISSRIRQAALSLLARREQTYQELTSKLTRKFISNYREYDEPTLNALIDDVIKQIQQEGLQSDERFTEAFIRYHSERGMGPKRIRRDLISKGVNNQIIEALLDENDLVWQERIAYLNSRRYMTSPNSERERAKRYRFFLNRGFTVTRIQHVLKYNRV